jgi:non-ribosomal peptide synthetase component F
VFYFLSLVSHVTSDLIRVNIYLAPSIFLSAAEHQQILEEFNGNATTITGDNLLHGLFMEQVERTPDHIALLGGKEEEGKGRGADGNVLLTYKELNEKAGHMLGFEF